MCRPGGLARGCHRLVMAGCATSSEPSVDSRRDEAARELGWTHLLNFPDAAGGAAGGEAPAPLIAGAAAGEAAGGAGPAAGGSQGAGGRSVRPETARMYCGVRYTKKGALAAIRRPGALLLSSLLSFTRQALPRTSSPAGERPRLPGLDLDRPRARREEEAVRSVRQQQRGALHIHRGVRHRRGGRPGLVRAAAAAALTSVRRNVALTSPRCRWRRRA